MTQWRVSKQADAFVVVLLTCGYAVMLTMRAIDTATVTAVPALDSQTTHPPCCTQILLNR